MATYAAVVDITDTHVQNVQKFASIWGDIQREVEELDGHITDAFAILGEHDFLVLFEAPNSDCAFQIAILVERYGLDTQTLELKPVERFGELVNDR